MNQLTKLALPLVSALVLSACGGGSSSNVKSSSSQAMSSAAPSSMSAALSSAAPSSMSSSMTPSSMAPSSMASSSIANVNVQYSVVITNLTAGQPLSPAGYVLHNAGYHAFSLGMPASVGLEKLAEGGDATDFIAEATAMSTVYSTGKASAMVLPGQSQTLSLSYSIAPAALSGLQLSLLTMPVNTNDAFSGTMGASIGALAIGESMSINTLAYDAGTEANSETALSVPGPAAGGEGFNAARDDVTDQVTMHPGVVTLSDGKSDSALTQLHRWDNPLARMTITRVTPSNP